MGHELYTWISHELLSNEWVTTFIYDAITNFPCESTYKWATNSSQTNKQIPYTIQLRTFHVNPHRNEPQTPIKRMSIHDSVTNSTCESTHKWVTYSNMNPRTPLRWIRNKLHTWFSHELHMWINRWMSHKLNIWISHELLSHECVTNSLHDSVTNSTCESTDNWGTNCVYESVTNSSQMNG